MVVGEVLCTKLLGKEQGTLRQGGRVLCCHTPSPAHICRDFGIITHAGFDTDRDPAHH